MFKTLQRLYPTFNAAFKVAGTTSFRLASATFLKTNEGGYGGNLQNIPEDLRVFLVARPGHKFIQCDLEGAEAVAVALMCLEGTLRDLVRCGIKPHNFLCLKLFPELFAHFQFPEDITPKQLKAHEHYKAFTKLCKILKREYDLAKRTVHGANYSMGWKTFMDAVLKGTKGRVVLTAAQAKNFLNTYLIMMIELKVFQAYIENCVRDGVELRNLFGHPITFVHRYTAALGRTGISWIPQSTVGQCSNKGAVRLHQYIKANKLPWRILNIVHDSILLECPDADAERAAEVTAQCLTFKLTSPIDGWECVIGVEKQIGRNWGKYHETENPEGLKVI